MSSWETNNDQSKLLSLLYGIDVTQYKTEDELNKRIDTIVDDNTLLLDPKSKDKEPKDKKPKPILS